MENNRRDFIKKGFGLAVAGIGAAILPVNAIAAVEKMVGEDFKLPELPYAYNALEPHIDKMTMEIHHTKHHQTYINNLSKALFELKVKGISVEDLCKNTAKYNMAVRNNAGGHYNHSMFWKWMKPNGGGQPPAELLKEIEVTFGSFDEFKIKFADAAKGRFGSGWAWLIVNSDKKLQITSTPNQDNPIMDVAEVKGSPILGLDVWEHAYYLNYQNRRPDYINAFWKVVNWDEVAALYKEAKK